MDEPPPYVDGGTPEKKRFSQKAIESGEAIAERNRERSRFCMNWNGKQTCLSARAGTRAEIQGSDLPEALVDHGPSNGATGIVRGLEELEKLGLMRAKLSTQPWSDDYWGHYKGIVGARYADPGFPGAHPDLAAGFNWKANYQYVRNHPAEQIARKGTDDDVKLLSPSEKYELLIGDKNFSITERMWRRGERYYESEGKVDLWMGICHGWAPAALMLPRPSNMLRLKSADGTHEIKFYPSDLKALADLLWAEGEYDSRFIGGRCDESHPRQDENGRIIRQECFDTNPGSWHLAITNQLGIAHRGLIMDASYDERIWNQPVLGYTYHYFNPKSMKQVDSFAEARVSMDAFAGDKFKRYRSKKTKSVVGVVMDTTYVAETHPSHAHEDSAAKDRLRTIRYIYDLELDSNGSIIGGEWYMNQHPDFLWVPAQGTHAVSDYEKLATGTWGASGFLPDSWLSAAREASEDGLPLAKIIEVMISKSASMPQ
ncbi:MAG: hypothetical protein ACJ763_04200 [Bdellovibrionia bacterium]